MLLSEERNYFLELQYLVILWHKIPSDLFAAYGMHYYPQSQPKAAV